MINKDTVNHKMIGKHAIINLSLMQKFVTICSQFIKGIKKKKKKTRINLFFYIIVNYSTITSFPYFADF